MTNSNIIVVGAGHNGLITAALLAKAGRKVLALERREVPGGQLASPSLHPGARLRPDIVRELGLAQVANGAPSMGGDPAYVAMLQGGGTLRLSSNAADPAALESIRRLSARDAARWPEFVGFMNSAASFLEAAYATPMPRMARSELMAAGRPLASLALNLRRLGRKDMFRVIRSLSMSAQELTEDWFETEALKAAIGALAVHGVTLGSMSAGTGYTLAHNWLNRGGLAHRSDAGSQSIVDALVAKLRASGGELRTSAPVVQILVDRQQVMGVRLANGEEIAARTVVSAADPRHTLLGLVGAPELPPEFVWHAQSIKMRGSVAKLELLVDGEHGIPNDTVVIAPSLRYIERAYDAAKFGEISAEPYLEVTTSGRAASTHFQFAPYRLKQHDWSTARSVLEQRALETLGNHFPRLRDSIREVRSITPLDLEETLGLTEGDLNHGQLILDQVFFMRPLPGWSDHRTPIDGLFLCGSGMHGGGGISGASGRNAARVIAAARA